tara:strand:+ start:93 stop:410 length:318 start_codon:yes stop_codon:yes gene_type:complete
MKSYEGGAIPFSAILGGRKTNKRTKKRVSKRSRSSSSRSKSSRSSRSRRITKNKCKCNFTGNEDSPKGLGFCEKCTPLNIIMRGNDGNLWKIEQLGKTKKWIKVN